METYPYPSSEGIIDLVRKSEFDRLKWELEEHQAKYDADVAELNERLTKQQADMLDTIVGLRADLARWQSLAGQLAEALRICRDQMLFLRKVQSYDTVIHAFECYSEIKAQAYAALAAYESATSATTDKPEITQ